MKKLLLTLAGICAITPVLASHYFTVCYYNWTKDPVKYDNNAASYKWKNRGDLVGTGVINSNTNKCFSNINDETMFSTDYIAFYVNDSRFAMVNPAFSKPYTMADDAQIDSSTKKNSYIPNTVVEGRDQYHMNVHVMDDGVILLSGSSDPKDTAQIIKPRAFKI